MPDNQNQPSTVDGAVQQALWLHQLNPAIKPRPSLNGNTAVDVAIIGGGFSGLWTAYYLSALKPDLSIMVVEKNYCGFGASGRNGGWAVGELAGSFETYAKMSTPAKSMQQARAVFDAVDEIGRVAQQETIDCSFAKGGNIRLARTTPQLKRQQEEVAHHHSLGFTEDEVRLLSADEARGYMNATKVKGGIFFAPCASLNPAELVTGLAATVEAAGVKVVEGTAVTEIDGRLVRTDQGDVTAGVVVRATEAYTQSLKGLKRKLLPVYSLMVATEPLPDEVFDEIGLAQRPTFGDDRFMVIYGQRTGDNRLAFGGRGVPYLFGSKISAKTELHQPSHQLIHDTLVDMVPAIADFKVTHRWGGVLGIPRDWVPGLTFNSATGQGTLGGYVGEGVAAANLAGRTMAELVAGEKTERTNLPWVGHQSRSWEPEPLRYLGVRASRRILIAADDQEEKTDKEAKLAFKISRLLRGA